MLTALIVAILVVAAAGLTYTFARGRDRKALGSEEANEVYQELEARRGKHRRTPLP